MTTTPAATITKALAEVFAELDAKFTADQLAWAQGRAEAIRQFKADATRADRADQWKWYAKLFALAGGKTWYGVINERTPAQVTEFVRKNCAAIIELRNAKIARKLIEAGIRAVTSQTITYSPDGFDGRFGVRTDKGDRVVTIQTIFAGGWNIQCRHQRTLVRVA